MIARREIGFTRAVAIAHVQQLAGPVDAQPLHRLARPAAAIAFALKPLLCGEDAVTAIGRHLALEVGFVAEQTEPVLDLPIDAQPADPVLGHGRDVPTMAPSAARRDRK